MDFKICAYCGKKFSDLGWPHIEGDSNRGVLKIEHFCSCLLYTSPSPRDRQKSRMPSSA